MNVCMVFNLGRALCLRRQKALGLFNREYDLFPSFQGPCQSCGCGGLMVSALDSGSSGPGSSPGRGHCVVFLGKTLYSHRASLHAGVKMGTGEFNAGGNPAMD